MRIYIAGPITGHDNQNRPAFQAGEKRLTELGHAVMNPASLPAGFEETHYMDICMAMVRSCEAILMLSGWEQSHGAKAEHALALKLGLIIFFEEAGK